MIIPALPKLHFGFLLVAGAAVISCSQAPTTHATAKDTKPELKAAASPVQVPADAGDTDLTDTIGLAQAQQACRDREPAAFFDAFIQSPAVRLKYSAESIETSLRGPAGRIISQNTVSSRAYSAFPIIMMDYYRKPAQPARTGATDEHIMLEINQSQSEQLSVEWTRVLYKGVPTEGDDLGEPVTLDGSPYVSGTNTDGQLLFEPTAECWQLMSDIRYQPGGY